MSHRTLALGLAVLLIASLLLVVFTSPIANAASTPRATSSGERAAIAPAATSITATLYNGYGDSLTAFYPGAVGWGSLAFLVYDPVDKVVNVTVTDPNATRDGVATPAFHFNATLNTTTHTYDSYTAGVFYKFPSNLMYGGGWKVNFSATAGGSLNVNITTYLYENDLSSTVGTGSTLPGESFGVFWSTLLDANEASLYTHATSVKLYGTYTGNGATQNLTAAGGILLPSPGLGHGEWLGVVPENVGPGTLIHIDVAAVTNVSGTVVENETSSIEIRVGALTIEGVGLTGVPPDCALVNDGYFYTGSVIASCAEVGATYNDVFTPIAGLTVMVQYWNGTAHVMPAGAPTALTTNVSGEAAFTFIANSPPFAEESAPHADALNFSVNLSGAGTYYHWKVWENATWTLDGLLSPTGIVTLSLDHTNYYEGVNGTATWAVSSTNLSKTGPLTAVGWRVTGPHGVTYEQGVLNTTGATGSFPFPILASMVPNTITVTVVVVNATDSFDAAATARVLGPSLLLTPSTFYYNAGSSASVGVVLNGAAPGASIEYQVWGYWNFAEQMLSNGTVANNSNIPVSIASSVPPTEIEVTVWASVGAQTIATNFVDLELAVGYSILLGVSTVSSYSDGSFQPGQTVTLNYQVVSVGGAALPQLVSFELLAEGYPYIQVIQNVGTSGTIGFTIPSNAPQGTILVELLARGALSDGVCFPTGGCDGLAGLYVNPSPSVLNLELGAGSGVTVGWLILLILVAVIAVVLFLVIRRGRSGRKGPSSATTGASSAPPEEWKEPTPESPPASETPGTPPPPPPSSDSPPPLPPPAEPPAGAT
ncbi:MAG TPA: hypothetical protein VEG42_05685 [Thermoplasmata archaeon]|nr:hypothetical protein [Thermoplasmata archaeon]